MSKKTEQLIKLMNSNVREVEVSDIFKFNERISEIPDIIKLTLGEPDFNTPDHIKKVAIKAIRDNKSHYSITRGDVDLRKAVSNYLASKYELEFDPDSQIIITDGVTEGVNDSLGAIVSEGDEVLIPTPSFSIYGPIVKLNGGIPIYINTERTQFKLTPELLDTELKKHPTAKAIIFNFPSNPTGVTYTKSQLEELARVLESYNIFVISDEIYSELTFDGLHQSFGNVLPDQTIVLNGVSKSHSMTGWRIGFVAGPKQFIDEIAKVHELAVTCATSISQIAATEALKNGVDDSKSMCLEYQKRCNYIFEQFDKLGFSGRKPDGTFYVFLKIPQRYEQNSFKFCIDLAQNAKVGLIPGESFGPGGEGYVRISGASSMENIKIAIQRIRKYLK